MSDDLVVRLKRIEGQIRGLQKLAADPDAAEETLTQIAAAVAALRKVGAMVFREAVRGEEARTAGRLVDRFLAL